MDESGNPGLVEITFAAELLIKWNFSEDIQLAFVSKYPERCYFILVVELPSSNLSQKQ